MPQKSYTKDQKVDDDDGHYIVVPEADLTERCRSLRSIPRRMILTKDIRPDHKTARPGHFRQSRPSLR